MPQACQTVNCQTVFSFWIVEKLMHSHFFCFFPVFYFILFCILFFFCILFCFSFFGFFFMFLFMFLFYVFCFMFYVLYQFGLCFHRTRVHMRYYWGSMKMRRQRVWEPAQTCMTARDSETVYYEYYEFRTDGEWVVYTSAWDHAGARHVAPS